MSRPDARDAIRALGGDPGSSSTDWVAAAEIEIEGVAWLVQVTALDGRSTARWYAEAAQPTDWPAVAKTLVDGTKAELEGMGRGEGPAERFVLRRRTPEERERYAREKAAELHASGRHDEAALLLSCMELDELELGGSLPQAPHPDD